MSSLRDINYKLTDRNNNGVRQEIVNLSRTGQVFAVSQISESIAAGTSAYVILKAEAGVFLQLEEFDIKTEENSDVLKVELLDNIIWSPDGSETRLMPYNVNRLANLKYKTRSECYSAPSSLVSNDGVVFRSLSTLNKGEVKTDRTTYLPDNVWCGFKITNDSASPIVFDELFYWAELPPGAFELEEDDGGTIPPPNEGVNIPGVVWQDAGAIELNNQISKNIISSVEQNYEFHVENVAGDQITVECEIIIDEFNTRRATLVIPALSTSIFYPGTLPVGEFPFNIIARSSNVDIGLVESFVSA